jgi:hypothetical protein
VIAEWVSAVSRPSVSTWQIRDCRLGRHQVWWWWGRRSMPMWLWSRRLASAALGHASRALHIERLNLMNTFSCKWRTANQNRNRESTLLIGSIDSMPRWTAWVTTDVAKVCGNVAQNSQIGFDLASENEGNSNDLPRSVQCQAVLEKNISHFGVYWITGLRLGLYLVRQAIDCNIVNLLLSTLNRPWTSVSAKVSYQNDHEVYAFITLPEIIEKSKI